eukprot:CAMPEP_0116881868 /NCGR_PEP_ID=MMETSP0463-20121206/13930_1 /TAXON_ID=181622 /ORGANISM="Strombidinopsis sp, Strain SopsisLIS2011" /LENGTH=63 /DNA_ID=CAMNT_0004534143 /DNA_START=1530 /DNA_END=1721 /DNA_ORIENTATION=+
MVTVLAEAFCKDIEENCEKLQNLKQNDKDDIEQALKNIDNLIFEIEENYSFIKSARIDYFEAV